MSDHAQHLAGPQAVPDAPSRTAGVGAEEVEAPAGGALAAARMLAGSGQDGVPTLGRLMRAQRHEAVLGLQRTAGNATVSRLLRPATAAAAHRAGADGPASLPVPDAVAIHRQPAPAAPATPNTGTTAAFDPALKQDFLNRCGQCNTKLDAAKLGTERWLASLSLAYRDAWKNHTDVLKAQDQAERLADELITNAALAFVPGGVGGMVGGAIKKLTKSASAPDGSLFLIDGIKDLAKWGLRSTGQAGIKGGVGAEAGSTGLTAFPPDPGAWRDLVEIRVKGEVLVATRILEGWQDKANKEDPDFDMSFDPVVAMDLGLKVAGQPAATLAPVPVAEYAKEFEKGFWSKWLETYGYALEVHRNMSFKPAREAPDSAVEYTMKKNVGKKIRKRCEALGLNIDQYAQKAKEAINKRYEGHRRGDFYMGNR